MKRALGFLFFIALVAPRLCPLLSPIRREPIELPPLVEVHAKVETNTPTPQPVSTATLVPPTAAVTDLPPTPTVTPDPWEYVVQKGDTLGVIADKFGTGWYQIAVKNGIEDPNYIQPGQVLVIPNPADPPSAIVGVGREIVISLSLQRLYAYENGEILMEFLVSTGLPETPTRPGEKFRVQSNHTTARMRGPGYDLPAVPWTMYYDGSYGIHGADWHNNFGNPMSHGCVNLRVEDAERLFAWALVDDPVIVVK
jgi:lipoprotein-anchoring transpeptidase ErfK/SrfK